MKNLIFILISFVSINFNAQNLKNPLPSEEIKELSNFFFEKGCQLNETQANSINKNLEVYHIKIEAIINDEKLVTEQKKEIHYQRRNELRTVIENILNKNQLEVFKLYMF